MKLVSIILLGLLTSPVNAQAKETWTFSSNYDRFTLTYDGGKFFYNGKAVQGSWAEDLRPVLDNEMNVACEGLPKKPDLRLKWTGNGQTINRNFYLKAKMASDGKNCLELTGPGVYYAPFHKSWFVGSEKISLDLSKGFEIGSELNTWASFKNKNGKLVSTDDRTTTNWETLAKLKRVLRNFPIDGRAHPEVFNDPGRNLTAKNIIIKAGGNTYKLRQVKDGVWLMQLPKVPWLILSPNFGLFDTMVAADWKSLYSDVLAIVKDPEVETDKRIEAVRSLKAKSSKDVFGAFHDVILEPTQNEEVKAEIVRVLRYYPSSQNMSVLVQALDQTDSNDLIFDIIKVLKLRNPKGPQIESNADPEEVQKAIAAWKAWAKKL